MKKQTGKNKLVIMRNLFLIKININRAGIFPLRKFMIIYNNLISVDVKQEYI